MWAKPAEGMHWYRYLAPATTVSALMHSFGDLTNQS